MATVIIGADICPIEGNRPYFLAGDARSLFHGLLEEFAAADLVVANLECPLVDRPSPILKTGPVFGEPGACLNGIKAAGIHVLGLANNHILDHGAAGLQSTLAHCAEAGIATVGAGANLDEARRLLVRQAGGVRIGILAMAEHEFSIAGPKSWGANPLDLIGFVRTVREQREQVDYLIVLLHGSHEFHVPTPRTQETCRFMVELGADAVLVQHPHLLGGHEQHRSGHIVYGQGALVMDEAIYRNRKSFHEGYLVKLVLERHLPARMEIVPFTQSDPVPGARRMGEAQEGHFRKALEKRAKAVQDPEFVRAEWLRFCREREHGYLSSLLGHNRLLRKLNAKGWIERWLHGKRLLGTRNVLCCETHREAAETIFEQRWRSG